MAEEETHKKVEAPHVLVDTMIPVITGYHQPHLTSKPLIAAHHCEPKTVSGVLMRHRDQNICFLP